MRFNIRCDMEGVTGVTSYEQVTPGNPRYQESKKALMSDLLAVVSGVHSVDPDAEIVIFDEHMDGRNVDILQLPAGVAYVSGKPAYERGDAGRIAHMDGMLLVGFHAKAGTPSALLPHTYEHEITDIQVNGTSIGEVGLEALIAGDAGVPTLFYSGDDAGAREIEQLVPKIVSVVVKESMGERAALCLGGIVTARILREQAAVAVKNRTGVPPIRVDGPVTFQVCLADSPYRKTLRLQVPDAFESEDSIKIEAPTVTDAYATYSAWRSRAKALVS